MRFNKLLSLIVLYPENEFYTKYTTCFGTVTMACLGRKTVYTNFETNLGSKLSGNKLNLTNFIKNWTSSWNPILDEQSLQALTILPCSALNLYLRGRKLKQFIPNRVVVGFLYKAVQNENVFCLLTKIGNELFFLLLQ